jgi:hypothetical protein
MTLHELWIQQTNFVYIIESTVLLILSLIRQTSFEMT